MVKLTAKEIKLVNAMRDNEYNDAIEHPTWTFAAILNSGIPAKEARGVISSLVQKGLVVAEEGDKKSGDEDSIGFTEAGVKLFDEADGEECDWGGPRLLKEVAEKPAKKTVEKRQAKIDIVAFTGMPIGTYYAQNETKTTVSVITNKNVELIFDKKTGIQINAKNPKFANRIKK